MQIHIAALTQKAVGYDEFTGRALDQERIAQRKSATGGTTEERPSSDQSSVARAAPPLQSIKASPEIAGGRDIKSRRHIISKAIGYAKADSEQKKSIRQRLAHVANVWDDVEETRDRDGVYGYLRAVFSLVRHYRGRRRTKKLMRRAFKFAGLPIDMNADPFAVVMRCTCEKKLDRKNHQ